MICVDDNDGSLQAEAEHLRQQLLRQSERIRDLEERHRSLQREQEEEDQQKHRHRFQQEGEDEEEAMEHRAQNDAQVGFTLPQSYLPCRASTELIPSGIFCYIIICTLRNAIKLNIHDYDVTWDKLKILATWYVFF